MIRIATLHRPYIDSTSLPEEFHEPLRDYVNGVLGNEELESFQGRWLLRVSFDDAADDDTADEVVQQLADGVIGFEQYPFDGIFWDILGVEPSAYAGYLRAMRYLRTQLAADVIESDCLYLLV